MADPLLAMIGAGALGFGAIIAVTALVVLAVHAGLEIAFSIIRLFRNIRES